MEKKENLEPVIKELERMRDELEEQYILPFKQKTEDE